MAAFMWNANPDKWEIVPPSTNSWNALKDYLLDTSSYVYWSTPVLQKQIKVGDRAFIWRTGTKSGGGPSGVVAIGRVAEAPRPLSSSTISFFAQPSRIAAAGWNEASAPSIWKTGIRIERLFWNAPLQVSFTASQGTLRTLSENELRIVEAEAARY